MSGTVRVYTNPIHPGLGFVRVCDECADRLGLGTPIARTGAECQDYARHLSDPILLERARALTAERFTPTPAPVPPRRCGAVGCGLERGHTGEHEQAQP